MQQIDQVVTKFLRFKLFVRDPIGLIVAASLFCFYLREFLEGADIGIGFGLVCIASLTIWVLLDWKTRFLTFLSTVQSKK
jgi:hypothetical protein